MFSIAYEYHVSLFVKGLDFRKLTNHLLCSWVFIPLWLMFDSYTHIAGALRAKQSSYKNKAA
jgi:hypothetical protein